MIEKLKSLIASEIDLNIKNLMKNVGILLVGDVGASILSLMAMTIIVKTLGLEKYGWLVLIQSYVLTVDAVVNFQSWQAFIKFGASSINNKVEIRSYIKQGVIVDFTTSFLGAIVGVISVGYIGGLLEWSNDIIKMVQIYSLTIFTHVIGTPIGYLRLKNHYNIISIHKFINSAIKVIVIFIVSFTTNDLEHYVYIYILLDLVNNLSLLALTMFIMAKDEIGNWLKAEYINFKEFWKFTIYTNIATTLDIPIKRLDVFIVSSVLPINYVSIYKIFKDIVSIFSKLSSPVFQAIYPQFAIEIENNNHLEAIKIARKITLVLLVLFIPISALIIFLSPMWLRVIFNQSVASEWLNLSLFIVFSVISTAFITIHPLFIALGFVKQNIGVMFVSNIGYFFAAYFLGQSFHLTGIILAYGIQLFIVLILKIMYMKNCIQFDYKKGREL